MIKINILVIFVSYFSFSFAFKEDRTLRKPNTQDKNHPPVVKFASPANNSVFDSNSPIIYSVNVTDVEDGDSKFEEINTKEVIIEVKYKGSSKAASGKPSQHNSPGLAAIKSSNCFNCHNFNSKSIGPSFHQIAEKYPFTAANNEVLQKHIKEGSTGIWGKEAMPTHPELSKEDTRTIVEWILKNGKDVRVNYYAGMAGAITLKQNGAPTKKGIYILTASYTDHGTKSPNDKRLTGHDVITIRIK
jgi:cytochrome c